MRCLVRDPRRLGPERVRVQLGIGDLADPASWRNALRGVDTVVHLAGGARDQPRATVEELNGLAAWRLLRAAERARARHFIWIEPLGATPHHPMRLQRAKALAAQAVAEAPMPDDDLRPLAAVRPGRPPPALAGAPRASCPPCRSCGRGIARTQPLWAEDAADCVMAAFERGPASATSATSWRVRRRSPSANSSGSCWPRAAAAGARCRCRSPDCAPRCRPRRRSPAAGLVTWDDAQMLAVEMLSARGTADAEALGVRSPRRVADVARDR